MASSIRIRLMTLTSSTTSVRITNTRYGAGGFENRKAISSAERRLIRGAIAASAAANRVCASRVGRRTQYSVMPLGEAAIARQPLSGSIGGQDITGTGRSSSANTNGTSRFATFSGATPKSQRLILPGRWRMTPTTRKSRPAIRIVRPTLSAPP